MDSFLHQFFQDGRGSQKYSNIPSSLNMLMTHVQVDILHLHDRKMFTQTNPKIAIPKTVNLYTRHERSISQTAALLCCQSNTNTVSFCETTQLQEITKNNNCTFMAQKLDTKQTTHLDASGPFGVIQSSTSDDGKKSQH